MAGFTDEGFTSSGFTTIDVPPEPPKDYTLLFMFKYNTSLKGTSYANIQFVQTKTNVNVKIKGG